MKIDLAELRKCNDGDPAKANTLVVMSLDADGNVLGQAITDSWSNRKAGSFDKTSKAGVVTTVRYAAGVKQFIGSRGGDIGIPLLIGGGLIGTMRATLVIKAETEAGSSDDAGKSYGPAQFLAGLQGK